MRSNNPYPAPARPPTQAEQCAHATALTPTLSRATGEGAEPLTLKQRVEALELAFGRVTLHATNTAMAAVGASHKAPGTVAEPPRNERLLPLPELDRIDWHHNRPMTDFTYWEPAQAVVVELKRRLATQDAVIKSFSKYVERAVSSMSHANINSLGWSDRNCIGNAQNELHTLLECAAHLIPSEQSNG